MGPDHSDLIERWEERAAIMAEALPPDEPIPEGIWRDAWAIVTRDIADALPCPHSAR